MKEREENIPRENTSASDNPSMEFKVAVRLVDPNIRLLKVRSHCKDAVERNWQTIKNYGAKSTDLLEWVRSGGNYGLTSPFGFCCFVDADTKEIQDALEQSLLETFRWSTGKDGHFQYAYFIEDSPIGCIPLKDGAYIKGKGGYALGPGSIHPNGTVYGSREIRDVPIATVRKEELLSALKNFLVSAPAESGGNFKIFPAGTAKIDRAEIVRILTPYWAWADGRRNEITLAIAGFIARSGGTEADAVSIISELSRLTRKGNDHIPGARYAFRRGGPVKGFRSLEQLMEEVIGNE